MSDALFEAGKVTNLRLKKELVEPLNRFAAEYHIEEKTEALHKYFKHLRNEKTVIPAFEAPQIALPVGESTFFCKGYKRMIKPSECGMTQNSPAFQMVCAKISPPCEKVR